MLKIVTAEAAAKLIPDNAVVAVSSSSGLACPDAMLAAIGHRFEAEQQPCGLTMLLPIAAGDFFGIKGIDHLCRPGLIARTICGSYPSAPSNAEPPLIWQMISRNEIAAYNVPSGILFDNLREAAARRPGVLTRVGLDTFVDPKHQGCAMNAAAAGASIVRHKEFEGEDYLYFPAVVPKVAIIRATTADERGNLTYEHEGAYLGVMEMALAARNTGGIVIAQVKRIVAAGSLRTHDVRVPGILVDYIVEAPDQWQCTQTPYDPAISGEVTRPLSQFETMPWGVSKMIARRVAQELKDGWAVNLGFGVSANVPRIFLEEGKHGAVTWMIEQGPVGGIPLLEFQFGCSANAEAVVPSPHQFTYFQAGGFDAALLSFLQIGADGSVNVHRLGARPHVTAGCGGFVDITSRARKIVYSGFFNAGAKLDIEGGTLKIFAEGKVRKLVREVEQVTFSGPRGVTQGQDVIYITERCVLKLTPSGIVVTEIAPGVDLERHVLAQSEFALKIAPDLKVMDAKLFRPEPMGLTLHA